MELSKQAKAKRNEYMRQYREKHAEELKRKKREWAEQNQEHLNEYHRKWMAEHPGKEAEYRNRYWEKKANDNETIESN